MTQPQEPNDRNREIDRQFRSLNRRVDRLEDTQITGRELNQSFDRVYEEIDEIDAKIDKLQSDFEVFRNEVNQKLDAILRHLNGGNVKGSPCTNIYYLISYFQQVMSKLNLTPNVDEQKAYRLIIKDLIWSLY